MRRQAFSQIWTNKPFSSRKTTVFVYNKIQAFKWMFCGELVSATVSLTKSQWIWWDVKTCAFWGYCVMKSIDIWKICIKSMNQYFPNDKCRMLWNPAWVKDVFTLLNRPVEFNVMEYKNFRFHIELIFKILLLA